MISIIPLSLRFKLGSLPPPVPSGTSKVTEKSHWIARCLFHFYRLLLCCKKFNSDLRGRKTAVVDTFSRSACVWVAFSTTFTVVGLAAWSSKRNTAPAAKIIVLTRKKQQLISPSATFFACLSRVYFLLHSQMESLLAGYYSGGNCHNC